MSNLGQLAILAVACASTLTFTSCEKDEFSSEEITTDSDIKYSTSSTELSISSATADKYHSNYPASKAIDGNTAYSSRWAGYGDPSNLILDLGTTCDVDYVKIAFARGDSRIATFQVWLS